MPNPVSEKQSKISSAEMLSANIIVSFNVTRCVFSCRGTYMRYEEDELIAGHMTSYKKKLQVNISTWQVNHIVIKVNRSHIVTVYLCHFLTKIHHVGG